MRVLRIRQRRVVWDLGDELTRQIGDGDPDIDVRPRAIDDVAQLMAQPDVSQLLRRAIRILHAARGRHHDHEDVIRAVQRGTCHRAQLGRDVHDDDIEPFDVEFSQHLAQEWRRDRPVGI